MMLRQILLASSSVLKHSSSKKKKMSDGNDDLEVYVYRGNKGEKVPKTVEKLIVSEGVQELPYGLCCNCKRLWEVTLPNGLRKIGEFAFFSCENLVKIRICNTVQCIEYAAFDDCELLTKVEFVVSSPSSPNHQLQTIDELVFSSCLSLQRIKLPCSVTVVGSSAFEECWALVEANLSTSSVTQIPDCAFGGCSSMQTVSLPNTVRMIDNGAFERCSELVTVLVSLDSQAIRIGENSFRGCRKLVNFVLPKDSTAAADSFAECELLHEHYSGDSARIAASLIGRFTNLPVHRMCYDHSRITVQELQQCIKKEGEAFGAIDEFGMTVFHVLFSTVEPRVELLEVLLDQEYHSYQVMNWKDANGNRPLDYLINNWTDGTLSLLRPTLQNCILDPLVNWGAMLWMEAMETKVAKLLFALQFKDDRERRLTSLNEVYYAFGLYKQLETTSILELALWKGKLKSGWSDDGSKRQDVDPVECRCVCGSDVVIPNVTSFLFIIGTYTLVRKNNEII